MDVANQQHRRAVSAGEILSQHNQTAYDTLRTQLAGVSLFSMASLPEAMTFDKALKLAEQAEHQVKVDASRDIVAALIGLHQRTFEVVP